MEVSTEPPSHSISRGSPTFRDRTFIRTSPAISDPNEKGILQLLFLGNVVSRKPSRLPVQAADGVQSKDGGGHDPNTGIEASG